MPVTTNSVPLVIDALKKEVARLEKVAAGFERSHSVHHDTVLEILDSIKQHIEMLEAGCTSNAA